MVGTVTNSVFGSYSAVVVVVGSNTQWVGSFRTYNTPTT